MKYNGFIEMDNKKKSLLYVVPRWNFFNEGSRGRVMHALGIAEGFSENNWDVTIIGGPGLSEYKEDLSNKVKFIEIQLKNRFLGRIQWDITLVKKYIQIIGKQNFDLFIVRYVILKYFYIFIYLFLLRKTKTRTVLEVNSYAFHYLNKINKVLTIAIAKIELFLSCFFDILYVVSNAMLEDERIRKCSSMVIAIPNGASSTPIEFKLKDNFHKGSLRLVYLGTLQTYWDFDFLLKSYSEFIQRNTAELHFYGDGPMEKYLQKMSYDQPQIVFHGRFKRKDLGYLLNKETDILVLPPKIQDDMALSGGLSTKLFDYLSFGLPIIAPSDGEICSVLEQNKSALLYDSRQVNSFVEKAEELIGNELLRSHLSKNAYCEYKKKYTWKARMQTLINKVSEIC